MEKAFGNNGNWDAKTKMKILLTLMELSLFIVIVVNSVLLIGALNAQQIYQYRELGINRFFLTLIISSILLFILPFFIKRLFIWAEQQSVQLRIKKLEDNILREIQNKKEFSLDELSEKYNIENDAVRDVIFSLVEEGIIRGNLEKTIAGQEYFDIDSGFVFKSVKDLKMDIFDEKIISYLSHYQFISLEKISKRFNVPVHIIERELKDKISSQQLSGYLQENTYHVDWPDYIQDLIKTYELNYKKCPNCSNKTLLNRPFCHWCGKRQKINEKD